MTSDEVNSMMGKESVIFKFKKKLNNKKQKPGKNELIQHEEPKRPKQMLEFIQH